MNQLHNITNIFLDAGGVILDESQHEHIRSIITSRILSSVKPQYSVEHYWRDATEAVHLFVPSVYNYILWKNTQDVARYWQLKSDLSKQFHEAMTPLILMKGIEQVVARLAKHYRIGILGQYDSAVKQVLAENNALQYFTFQNTQDQFKLTKPDVRYFEQVLQSANADPTESVMVGDRIDKDIIPAKAIGMKTVRVTTGIHKGQRPRTPEEFPDVEIQSIEQLLEVFPI